MPMPTPPNQVTDSGTGTPQTNGGPITPGTAEDITGVQTIGNQTDLAGNIMNIINGVIGVLALVAVVIVIVGGVGYMTSSGDAGKVKKAKDTILYGIIGLVVCVLAFAIVNFVIANIIAQH